MYAACNNPASWAKLTAESHSFFSAEGWQNLLAQSHGLTVPGRKSMATQPPWRSQAKAWMWSFCWICSRTWPRPDQALAEIRRVLRPGGPVLLQVPLLYPLHDEPNDYRRWTVHSLRQLASKAGLTADRVQHSGRPIETAGLLLNIPLAKAAVDWIERRSLWMIASPLLLSLTPVINVLTWLLARALPSSDFMPGSYCILLRRPAVSEPPHP